jgi:hypothetical protein
MSKETGARATLRSRGFVPAVEAAKRLGFTAQTVYDWADAEKIHQVRLGAARWVEWKSVVAYFKTSSPEAAKLVGLT